jgi:hypothetical protein
MTPNRRNPSKTEKILLSKYRQGKAARAIAVRSCALNVVVVVKRRKRPNTNAAQGDLFAERRGAFRNC